MPLQVGAAILGGLASSRLDNALVRGEQSAVSVAAFIQPFHRLSMFEIQVNVKDGQDVDAVSRRLDALVAEFLRTGPTQDEVRRAVMRQLSGRVQGLEQVGGFGGKAVALAEGMLYANDPEFLPHPAGAAGPGDAGAGPRRHAALALPPGPRHPRR